MCGIIDIMTVTCDTLPNNIHPFAIVVVLTVIYYIVFLVCYDPRKKIPVDSVKSLETPCYFVLILLVLSFDGVF